ncbi:transferrin-binding protein-like solute binding protein [Novosphingobium taihuense]|uniref:Transferrin-binding protein B C-lobe/N-lobe beta-barrel domain-containing protein n=1 Tax=Novosphingobium taihuense TaxID=260085 RepID=A0A7W7AE18_9SPHN|nr:transferrin-binding protein-like solute binding protein [Novosphingobium taihuense]MBB4615186.1 hypothetical protein [Novosphingobium taihuense]TWH84222.1 Transferrin binding protein-like solute binding protein [Novosphingobium taihuense]
MNRKILTATATMFPAFLLASCGGGSDGGMASTPAPVYKTLAELSGDQTFQSGGIVGDPAGIELRSESTVAFGQGVEIKYFAASDTYNLNNGSGLVVEFTPAQVVNRNENTVTWQKPNGPVLDTLSISNPSVNGVKLSYVLLGNWTHIEPSNGRAYSLVGGVPTQAGDVPRSGSATYSTQVVGLAAKSGSPYLLFGESTGTFSANFASNSVSTSLTLAGKLPGNNAVTAIGNYSGSGTISSSGPGFQGTLTGSNASGAFSGAFFGPRGAEAGYTFFLNGTTDSTLSVQGALFAKKN